MATTSRPAGDASACAGSPTSPSPAARPPPGGDPAGARHRVEPEAGLAQAGDDHPLGEAAGADQAGPPHVPADQLAVALPARFRRRLGLVRGLVLDHHAQGRVLVGGEPLVGLGGVVDGETRRDQIADRQAAGGDQLDDSRHVAALRPAHVTDRVILAVLLVGAVIPARSVGAGQTQIDLLVVEGRPREVHPDVADDHHPAAITAQTGGQLERIAGRRRGGDDHRIAPRRGGRHRLADLPAGDAEVDPPELPRPLDRAGVEIDPDHGAAGRLQQQRRQLADQAEAEHGDPVAQHDLRLAHAVQGDRADAGEAALLEGDRVGKGDAEVAGNAVDLRVNGIGAAHRDAVTDGDVADILPHRQRDARRRVAQHRRLVEARAHGSHGLANSVAARLLDHLRDLVGPLPRLAEQALLRRLHLGPLGTGAEQAGPHVDQHGSRRDHRPGNLQHLDATVPQSLGDLLHCEARAYGEPGAAGALKPFLVLRVEGALPTVQLAIRSSQRNDRRSRWSPRSMERLRLSTTVIWCS